ncbi:hypothetical protein ACQQ7I_05120 [Corynebacterium diphtheriae]|nr:hypothetical protein CIP107532_00551 [Corynebacterium diphtheriae]
MNQAQSAIERIFFIHPVTVHGVGGRTATGRKPGTDRVIKASINAENRVIAMPVPDGTEVVCSATICWATRDGIPDLAEKITLPEEFGLKGERRILSAQMCVGTDQTPNHVKVMIE